MALISIASVLLLTAPALSQPTRTDTPRADAPKAGAHKGEIKGSAWSHSPESLQAVVAQARTVVASAHGGPARFEGSFSDAPKSLSEPTPVVVFLHGSSGLGLAAIARWQGWLAGIGVSSVAPNSFALPDRVTYKSPIDRADYERIHAMRASEIQPMLDALRGHGWSDAARVFLAGTSEGAVAVARHRPQPAEGGPLPLAGRIVYSWNCEANYFVESPRNGFGPAEPVLNVISNVDPYFSQANAWLDNPQAKGHCASALKGNPNAAIVLVPDAPHTLLMDPGALHATRGFIESVARSGRRTP